MEDTPRSGPAPEDDFGTGVPPEGDFGTGVPPEQGFGAGTLPEQGFGAGTLPDGLPGFDRTPRDELAEATAHGQVYLRRLQRSQLNLSLVALVAFGAIFGVLPLALLLFPHIDRIRLLTVPLSMWIIVVPMLPVFLVIGRVYARRADEIDDAFRDLVQR